MHQRLANILFVHHGTGLGGAPIYLSGILNALDNKKYNKLVFMRQSPAVDIIRETGTEIEIIRNIPTFRHTTASWYSPLSPKLYFNLLGSYVQQGMWKNQFLQFKPDIIHLNSITLLPLCKPAQLAGAKVVVSVQETVLSGLIGLRKGWIKNQLSQYADAILYISKYDQRSLDANVSINEVIPNWVDLKSLITK